MSEETPAVVAPIATETILQFIRKYREMEKMPYESAFLAISNMVAKHHVDHLCNAWKGKKKEFASWYLNLSNTSQIGVLRYWGIGDPEDEAYLARAKEDKVYALFGQAPRTVAQIHNLMIFFNNHGINPEMKGMTFDHLPPSSKRFGNGKNWGDYVLSHPDLSEQLSKIVVKRW